MASSWFAGYAREGERCYRRGRDTVTFSPDFLRAEVDGPEGAFAVEGEAAHQLRLLLEVGQAQGDATCRCGSGPCFTRS